MRWQGECGLSIAARTRSLQGLRTQGTARPVASERMAQVGWCEAGRSQPAPAGRPADPPQAIRRRCFCQGETSALPAATGTAPPPASVTDVTVSLLLPVMAVTPLPPSPSRPRCEAATRVTGRTIGVRSASEAVGGTSRHELAAQAPRDGRVEPTHDGRRAGRPLSPEAWADQGAHNARLVRLSMVVGDKRDRQPRARQETEAQ
jgi:hypothetical protein